MCASAQQVDSDFRVSVGATIESTQIDRPSNFVRYRDGPCTLDRFRRRWCVVECVFSLDPPPKWHKSTGLRKNLSGFVFEPALCLRNSRSAVYDGHVVAWVTKIEKMTRLERFLVRKSGRRTITHQSATKRDVPTSKRWMLHRFEKNRPARKIVFQDLALCLSK